MTMRHLDPAPEATYSSAVIAAGLVHTAGQVGQNSTTGVVPGEFEEEVHLALDNLERVLAAAGSHLGRLVMVTAYLADLRLADTFNRVYRERVPHPRPARATVQVEMFAPYRVELACVAALDRSSTVFVVVAPDTEPDSHGARQERTEPN